MSAGGVPGWPGAWTGFQSGCAGLGSRRIAVSCESVDPASLPHSLKYKTNISLLIKNKKENVHRFAFSAIRE